MMFQFSFRLQIDLCSLANHSLLTSYLLMLAPNLTKVTAAVGLWGWAAISLAVGSLIMFYRCSR